MNDHALSDLLARARANPPDTSGDEFAFETRLLTTLHATQVDCLGTSFPWRLWPWFAAPAVALALWTLYDPPDFYPNFPIGQNDDLSLVEYLTGTSL